MSDPSPHDLVIEGLENLQEIGVGGFATVYKADQPAFRRTVAVKVLGAVAMDEQSRERFERECHAMGSLSDHPHIVTVYDNGFIGGQRPYLVMAFLPGGSLQERLDRDGPIPWDEATLYGVQLAGALETAHRASVIHRDIKPANVLMSSFGDAQLTDFGIARISGGHETKSGVITASMAHAPPEILDGQRPTVAADVYSLGSTIFELIYGAPAFENPGDESMVPMLRRILSDPPPDLRARGVPDAVCQVLEKAMAKDPAQRQQSAVAFGRELGAARKACGLDPGKLTVPAEASLDLSEGDEINFVSAPAPTTPVLPPSPTATQPVPVAGATQPVAAGAAATAGYVTPAAPAAKPRRTGLLVGLGILAVLVIGAVVGVVIVAGRGTNQVASTTTVPPTTEATTEAPPTTGGYNRAIEENFISTCAKGKNATLIFCRCVYRGLQQKIPYDEFLDIEAKLRNGTAIADTPMGPIVEECASAGSSTSEATTN